MPTVHISLSEDQYAVLIREMDAENRNKKPGDDKVTIHDVAKAKLIKSL
jgi:hypothetical protein